MPVPHLEIRIVQRSKGSSAVAGAAYQAGEKLFSEYDQKMKNYLCKKEVVYTEVMLPTNKDALEMYDELLEVATRYAAIRANWPLLSREEKNEQDPGRTSCHNSVITHFNMLARYLKQQGKSATWRDGLGYEEDDGYYRKAIGDFACYLVFVNSINAR